MAKYDGDGTQLWVKQFGTSNQDYAEEITTDNSGNVYVTGTTNGNLPGFSNLGSRDVFVAKYNATGNQIWIKQFGTSSADDSYGISTDNFGNIYITGGTYGSLSGNTNLGNLDAFIAKYDPSGTQLWVKQFGTSDFESGSRISVDGNGNIYVAGSTNGSAFIAKYDGNGTQLWVKKFGLSSFNDATGISTDHNGNIYVTGSFLGFSNNFRDRDVFVTKYDASGNQLWIKLFGTSGSDTSLGISNDSNANVYVVGGIDNDIGNVGNGSLPGNTSSGPSDAFIAGFDSNGNLLNTANTSSTLSINDVTLTEGNNGTKNATFTVTLSNPVDSIVSVNYATANNTATAGSDYLATNGTLTFNPNETTKTITVQVNGDTQVELNESFFLNLSNLQTNGSNVTLTDNQGQATITNDDTATISINDVTVTEGNNGITNAVFTVSSGLN